MRHEESLIQMAVIRWYRLQYPHLEGLLVGYPAGIHLGMTARVRAKAMGLKAGMPDLMLFVPRKESHGLFLELKTQTGKLSKVQKEYHETLRSQLYTIVTCHSFEEAIDEIRRYLS